LGSKPLSSLKKEEKPSVPILKKKRKKPARHNLFSKEGEKGKKKKG